MYFYLNSRIRLLKIDNLFSKVHDDEPSSFIAYTLRSNKYLNYLRSYFGGTSVDEEEQDDDMTTMTSQTLDDDITIRSQSPPPLCHDDEMKTFVRVDDAIVDCVTSQSTCKDDSTSRLNDLDQSEQPRPNSPHLNLEFQGNDFRFYCKVYHVIGFKDLRKLVRFCFKIFLRNFFRFKLFSYL